MATRFYGVQLGGGTAKGYSPDSVSEAAATTSRDVELAVIYTNAGWSKTEVLKAIEAIRDYIVRDTWPPA